MSVPLMCVRRMPGLGPKVPLRRRKVKTLTVEGLAAGDTLLVHGDTTPGSPDISWELAVNGLHEVPLLAQCMSLRAELFGKNSLVSVWAE